MLGKLIEASTVGSGTMHYRSRSTPLQTLLPPVVRLGQLSPPESRGRPSCYGLVMRLSPACPWREVHVFWMWKPITRTTAVKPPIRIRGMLMPVCRTYCSHLIRIMWPFITREETRSCTWGRSTITEHNVSVCCRGMRSGARFYNM